MAIQNILPIQSDDGIIAGWAHFERAIRIVILHENFRIFYGKRNRLVKHNLILGGSQIQTLNCGAYYLYPVVFFAGGVLQARKDSLNYVFFIGV